MIRKSHTVSVINKTKGMDSMKIKTYKRLSALLTMACVLASAVPAADTYNMPINVTVTAAEASAVKSGTLHLPDSLLKENGYVFGIRKNSSDTCVLYYQDARVRDANGVPTGKAVDLADIEKSLFPKPDFKTMNNLTGEDATEETPATGEKLEMEQLVNKTVEDYFLNPETGAWYTDVEKVPKVAVPVNVVNGIKTPEPGIIIEPEIPETKRLTDNTAFMEALIKAYDAEEGHEEENSFKNNPDLAVMNDDVLEEITGEGYAELYRIFADDIKTNANKVSDVRKTYNAVVSNTQAKELNRINREITSSDDVDLEKTKWVLETMPDLTSSKKVYPKTNSYAKFWAMKDSKATSESYVSETAGSSVIVSKTTANGKFNSEVVLKAVSSDYSPVSAKLPEGKGTVYGSVTFYIEPAKCSAYKENTLNTEKTVSGISFSKTADNKYDLTLDEGKSFRLPFAAEDGTDKTLIYEAHGKGFTVKSGIVKAYGEGNGTIKVYPKDCYDKNSMTLTINVTSSSALKAIRANTNTISMYPGASQSVSLGTVPPSYGRNTYYIHGLNAAYTAEIKDELLTISSEEGKALPKTNKIAVTIVKDNKNLSGIKNVYLTINGIAAPKNITRLNENNKKTGSDGAVEINIPRSNAYNLGISAYPVTCDQTLIPTVGIGINDDGTLDPGFQPVTAESYEEFIALYGPGGELQDKSAVANVNMRMDRLYSRSLTGDPTAVARPSADDESAYSEWLTFYDEGVSGFNKSKMASQTDTTALKVSGDVVSSDKAGTYYLQYTSAARTASDEPLLSKIYKINVYDTGSSIVMNDLRSSSCYDSNGDKKLTSADEAMSTDETYAVVCGHLMTTKSADTDNAKIFKGGTTINIAEPYCTGDSKEEIEWKCSKPAAIRITKGADYKTVENGSSKTYSTLDLLLCQPGLTDSLGQPVPLTVTGTSKYTKQKFTFKISVMNDTDVSQNLISTSAKLTYTDMNGNVISQPKKIEVGDMFRASCSSGVEGAAGKVKYESSDKKVLTVNPSGQVKAVGSGTATIKAVMTINDKRTTTLTASVNITVL